MPNEDQLRHVVVAVVVTAAARILLHSLHGITITDDVSLVVTHGFVVNSSSEERSSGSSTQTTSQNQSFLLSSSLLPKTKRDLFDANAIVASSPCCF